MTEPQDPFDSSSFLDGLEEALESFDDEETREVFREFVHELERAKLDTPALFAQAGPISLMRGVMSLEDGRARAVAFWTLLSLKQAQLGPAYHAWLTRGE